MQNETLALGVIKSVQKLYLEVQLPHGFLGRVNIYDVSDKYTELLRESAETGIIQVNEILVTTFIYRMILLNFRICSKLVRL